MGHKNSLMNENRASANGPIGIYLYFLYIRIAFEYIEKYIIYGELQTEIQNIQSNTSNQWEKDGLFQVVGNTGHSFERNVLSYVYGVLYINSLLIKDMNI